MSDGNREYKNDVFCMLMEDKKNALDVYNALNDSHYENPDDVEIVTLEKSVSLTVHNDCAFVVDASLSVYEHQSTICPNMPIRSLIYFTMTIRDMIKDRNIYGKSLIKIPLPHFVVFYNGESDQPSEYTMKLSDAFEKSVYEPELELTCKVYNINDGKNEALLKQCQVLREYMIFVDYVRAYHKEQDYKNLEMAINLAIDRCIRENVLKDFLEQNRSEVLKVTQLDYTFDRQIELERKDARAEALAEGRAEGIAEGRAEGIAEGRAEGMAAGRAEGIAEGIAKGRTQGSTEILIKLVTNGALSTAQAAQTLGITEEAFISSMNEQLCSAK